MAETIPAPDAKTNGRRDIYDLSDEELEIMFGEQAGMKLLTQDNIEHGLEMARAWG